MIIVNMLIIKYTFKIILNFTFEYSLKYFIKYIKLW